MDKFRVRRNTLHRRAFLAAASGALLAPGLPLAFAASGKRRVAVIGHTGRGNYGHGLDTVWLKIPETEIVAIADGDETAVAKELQKLGIDPAPRGFTDYRRMLAEVRPEFVAVAPRHPDQHRDMTLAAIEAGARGVYVEKPFCRTPAEADELVAACQRHNARIAVAHRNRYHPVLPVIDRIIAGGEIGRLLEIRGRGLGDRRGGGEDLWVLGSHVMNLFHHFGGEPLSCSAVMLQNSRPVTKADVADGAEGLGPLAADEVHARYRMSNGVTAYYDSIANDGSDRAGFGAQLIGTRGVISIHIDKDPLAHLTPGNPFQPVAESRPWIPITSAGPGKPEPHQDRVDRVADHVLAVRDLVEACDTGREPLCDARAGAVTVEMICAVFDSHRQGGREVPFPLEERGNALRLM